jgi:isocitrate/isopropylmalate dehydrogenase
MNFLVLPGDDIGPEISDATLGVLEAADRRFKLTLSFERREIGLVALKKHGTTLPAGVLERAKEVGGVILGPISHSTTRRARRAASTCRLRSA